MQIPGRLDQSGCQGQGGCRLLDLLGLTATVDHIRIRVRHASGNLCLVATTGQQGSNGYMIDIPVSQQNFLSLSLATVQNATKFIHNEACLGSSFLWACKHLLLAASLAVPSRPNQVDHQLRDGVSISCIWPVLHGMAHNDTSGGHPSRQCARSDDVYLSFGSAGMLAHLFDKKARTDCIAHEIVAPVIEGVRFGNLSSLPSPRPSA